METAPCTELNIVCIVQHDRPATNDEVRHESRLALLLDRDDYFVCVVTLPEATHHGITRASSERLSVVSHEKSGNNKKLS